MVNVLGLLIDGEFVLQVLESGCFFGMQFVLADAG